MSQTQFKMGETVVLKSGGPKMTIIRVPDSRSDNYFCTWFGRDNQVNERDFPGEALEKAKNGESPRLSRA